MTDVYNNSVFERNSIQSVPAGYIDHEANDLFRFMGTFWKNIHEGSGIVRMLQKVRGIKMAQFYLDLIESLKLQDRKGLPVFHRELWKPIILRKSMRDKSQENILKIGGDIVLGRQPAGSKYGEGTELSIGSLASLKKYVTYPVDSEIASIVSGIANNVINPSVSYSVGAEFPSTDVVYMNGTLIFPAEKDPFAENSGFDVYDVSEFYDDGSGIKKADQETVLWASDVLIDKNYVSDHMAYALGVSCDSSSIAKRILNAGWDAINCGLTPELFRTLLAALLNIPVIQSESERISEIVFKDDGTKDIVTDKHTYTVYKKAKLRACIKQGAVLRRGELLDEAIKIYPLLTDVSEEKLAGITEYAGILRQDVPVISIPKPLIRANTVNGLSVDWEPVDVLDTFELDANSNRKLYFKIGGSEEDVTAFWEDTWSYAEKNHINLEEYFSDCEPEYASPSESDSSSSTVWKIVPAKFFLKYMLGGNTLIVTLDTDQVEDTTAARSSMFFNLLNQVIPSGMRLFFIEHTLIDDEDDTYNVGTVDNIANTEEEVDKFVESELDDEMDYSDLPGMKGKRMPTYDDQIEMKLFRNRKRSAD